MEVLQARGFGRLSLPGCVESPAQAPKLELPDFGVGAWAWGDKLFWGYDEKQDQDIRAGGPKPGLFGREWLEWFRGAG